LSYDDIEKVMKDVLIDNGISGGKKARQGSQPQGRDRLAEIESKLAQLQKFPKTGDISQTEKRAMVNGKEACMFFNTRGGCRRPTTSSGCKSDKREFAHVCNVYDKSKSAYCLGGHPRKDHK